MATLSVMLNMISGVESFAVSELDVKPQPEVIGPGDTELAITAIDSEGKPVADATVLVKRGSTSVDSVAVAKTGTDGTANVSISPSLGPNQVQGTLSIDVKPPSGSKYMDRRENSEVLVVEGA